MYTRNRLGYTVFTEEYTRKHLYGTSSVDRPVSEAMLRIAIEQISKAGIERKPEMDDYDPAKVSLPLLLTDDINTHFDRMADELYGGSFRFLNVYQRKNHSEIPTENEYKLKPGWTRYSKQDGKWVIESVPYPTERVFTFDTETFVKGSRFSHPIIGSAISEKACYLWLHESFVNPDIEYQPRLIPIGTGKIIITWNGSYDAQRTEERYTLDTTSNIWVDCMAMHRLCYGIDSKQQTFQGMLKKKPYIPKPPWILSKKGCGASLLEAYNFHTGGSFGKESKDPRNLFVKATSMAEIAAKTVDCLDYAIRDVVWTDQLFNILWKTYTKRAPAKSVWAAHFIIHDALLPVNENWHQWVRDTEAKYQSDMAKRDQIVKDLADSTYEQWRDGLLDPSKDEFLRHLDWDYKKDESSPYYKIPNWYKSRIHPTDTFNTNPKTETVTYLLRLRWKGHPIEYVKNKTKDEEGGWMYKDEYGEYNRLEHKSGDEKNVGAVFNDFYLNAFESGIMTSDSNEAKQVMEIVNNNSYWLSIRSRCMEAHIERIEDPEHGYPINLMAPMMSCHSTITGRSSDKLWNTAASHLGANKLAMEFKSMCMAPKGYKLMFFDFSSQELQIGGAYSNAEVGLSGSSPYSHMLITGKKSDETDMYSLEAAKVGVSRSIGKIILLGAQYLAGWKTLMQKVYAKNPAWGLEYIGNMTKQMLANFRGVINRETGKYEGGSAAKAFNYMIDLVLSENPSTPNLGTKMPPAIQPKWNGVKGGILPSNVNFTIQAAASSYGQLATTLVAINWLCKKANIWSRYVISLH